MSKAFKRREQRRLARARLRILTAQSWTDESIDAARPLRNVPTHPTFGPARRKLLDYVTARGRFGRRMRFAIQGAERMAWTPERRVLNMPVRAGRSTEPATAWLGWIYRKHKPLRLVQTMHDGVIRLKSSKRKVRTPKVRVPKAAKPAKAPKLIRAKATPVQVAEIETRQTLATADGTVIVTGHSRDRKAIHRYSAACNCTACARTTRGI